MLPMFFNKIDVPLLINTFFLFSFFGWCMEMIVIRREKGRFENRGFAKSPFCIIYGFGAMIGYAVLKPFSFNWIVLFIVGAMVATAFEFLTAKIMLSMFGSLWWDYTNKPLNYKGILCLESTIGWGLISVLLFAGLHNGVMSLASKIPSNISSAVAFVLVLGYVFDFSLSLKKAMFEKNKEENNSAAEVN